MTTTKYPLDNKCLLKHYSKYVFEYHILDDNFQGTPIEIDYRLLKNHFETYYCYE